MSVENSEDSVEEIAIPERPKTSNLRKNFVFSFKILAFVIFLIGWSTHFFVNIIYKRLRDDQIYATQVYKRQFEECINVNTTSSYRYNNLLAPTKADWDRAGEMHSWAILTMLFGFLYGIVVLTITDRAKMRQKQVLEQLIQGQYSNISRQHNKLYKRYWEWIGSAGTEEKTSCSRRIGMIFVDCALAAWYFYSSVRIMINMVTSESIYPFLLIETVIMIFLAGHVLYWLVWILILLFPMIKDIWSYSVDRVHTVRSRNREP